LLRVLDRPEIPLNTNASENDIRTFVTKRKISGGTVSHNGRDARDIMLGLARHPNSAPRRTYPPRSILVSAKQIARKFAPVTQHGKSNRRRLAVGA
jgi:hypothetical protein